MLCLSRKQSERNSNLELLRIISMILIVMSHSDDFLGLYSLYSTNVCANKLIMNFLHLGGQIGVGCFILISGYFMVEQQFKLKRILRLWGEVLFYTISIYVIFIITRLATGSLVCSDAFVYGIRSFFPVLTASYWFVPAYIILMLAAPFFNKFINTISKSTYQKFLILLITVYSVLSGGFPYLLTGIVGGRLGPVFVLYFIAGYIRKYVDCSKHNSKKHVMVALLGYVILYGTVVIIDIIGARINSERLISMDFFYRPLNSPIVMIINVELFLAFVKMEFKSNKLINYIASATFGVYIIHNNQIISRHLLPYLFPLYQEKVFLTLLLSSIGVVILVYVICTVIDLVRQKTVEQVWLRYLDNNCSKIEQRIHNIVLLITDKLSKLRYKYYG